MSVVIRGGSGKRSVSKGKIRFDWAQRSLKQGTHRTPFSRLAVQGFFTLLSLWMGFQFYRFVQAAQNPAFAELPYRPPGVEGYLPISGLMGALDWLHRGELNTVHPAATILFLLFVVLAVVFRKSFCGWICPVGFLSESLARLGRQLFGRNFLLPKWVDIPLRSLKYLILSFFLWAIFSMSALELYQFINSPYNKVSDIKMLEFFLNLSTVGLIVIGALTLLSIPIEGFWCRYMCPYGALMGLVSYFSPTKVRRNVETCTECESATKSARRGCR